MLSERSHSQKAEGCMITFVWYPRKEKSGETRKLWLPEAGFEVCVDYKGVQGYFAG